jgi:hypothetical protein
MAKLKGNAVGALHAAIQAQEAVSAFVLLALPDQTAIDFDGLGADLFRERECVVGHMGWLNSKD